MNLRLLTVSAWLSCLLLAVAPLQHTKAQCSDNDLVLDVPEPLCVGQAAFIANRTNFDAGAAYSVRIGNEVFTAFSFSYTFTDPGNYNIVLRRELDGCRDSLVVPVTVEATPIEPEIIVDNDNPCGDEEVNFTVQNPQNGVTYEWDFRDDGATAEGTNVSHAFSPHPNGRNYTVRVTPVSAGGCQGPTASITIRTRPTPDVRIVPDPPFRQCIDPEDTRTEILYTFTNQTRVPAGASLTYTVDFGDGSPTRTITDWEVEDTIMHTYPIGSRFLFTISVDDGSAENCDVVYEEELIYTREAVSALRIEGEQVTFCEGDTVWVENLSINANNFVWIWGDGTMSEVNDQETQFHVYNIEPFQNTEIEINLIADNGACNHRSSTTIRVRPSAKPAFRFNGDLCITDDPNTSTATFINTSWPTDGNDAIQEYVWLIENLETGEIDTTRYNFDDDHRHYFDSPGRYRVSLFADNICGGNTFVQELTVGEVPESIFNIQGVTDPSNPTCTVAPQAELPQSGCLPLTLDLLNASTGNDLRFRWSVTGGAGYTFAETGEETSAARDESLTFTEPGIYTINLRATNNCGTANSCFQVEVLDRPVLNPNNLQVTNEGICGTQEVNFEFLSPDPDYTFQWTILDADQNALPTQPEGADGANPQGLTLNPGDYFARFVASNACGDSTVVAPFNVPAPPVADAGDDTLFFCLNDAVFNLTPVGNDPAGNWGGSGVTNGNLFSPAAAGVGAFEITYSVGSEGCGATDTKPVVVAPLPQINLLTPEEALTVCADAPAFTLEASASVAGSGEWGGHPAISAAGTFDPAASGAGTFTVAYTFTPDEGNPICDVVAEYTVTINPLPEIDLSALPALLCNVDEEIPLTGYSPLPNAGGTGTWSAANGGITQNGNDVTFNPSVPGTGAHWLVYTFVDDNGCVAADSIEITVEDLQPVTAGNDTLLCLGFGQYVPVGFFPAQLSPSEGRWRMVGTPTGATITAEGVFEATAEGAYQLEYTYGTGSCQLSDTIEIEVFSPPSVFAGPDQLEVCATDPIIDLAAQDGVSPLTGGVWSGTGVVNEGLGLFDPQAVAASETLPATVTIDYTYTDPATGCDSTHSKTIVVNPLPEPDFATQSEYCLGQPYTFENLTPEIPGQTLGFLWQVGTATPRAADADGNFTYTFNTVGEFQMTLIAETSIGCDTFITKTVEVIQPTTPSFAKQVTTGSNCGPVTVEFTNTSTGFDPEYVWDMGNGNTYTTPTPPAQVYRPGFFGDTTYTISLSVTNFCETVAFTDTIIVKPIPTANFIFERDTICSDYPMTINNFSYGLPTEFIWDFGDGSEPVVMNTADSVVHPFVYDGVTDTTYTVTLIASNECGSDTLSKELTIVPNILLARYELSQDNGCAPYRVTFESNQIRESGNRLLWQLDLDDPSSTRTGGLAQEYVYEEPGVYTARLMIFNDCYRDTFDTQITVYALPEARVEASAVEACLGEPITFFNRSPNAFGGQFDFGDGSPTVNGPVQTHAYDAPGQYTVRLLVTDTNTGCLGEDTLVVNVSELPYVQADFRFDTPTGCAPHVATLSSPDTDPRNQHLWQFDLNDPTSVRTGGNIASYNYEQPGTYTARLIVFNACSRDTVERSITVLPPATAELGVSKTELCLGEPFNAFNLSPNFFGGWITYGDGSDTVRVPNPAPHVYEQPGTYWVTLQVLDTETFCPGRDSVQVTVNELPFVEASFTVDPPSGCSPHTATFTSDVVDARNDYLWHFDITDPNTTRAGSPTETFEYTEAGTYTARLVIRNDCNRDTFETEIVVRPSPVAQMGYSATEVCQGEPITFFNESENFFGGQFNFGDGNTANIPNPAPYVYGQPGTYTVLMTIVSPENGCPSTDSVTVTVHPNAIADFDYPELICLGDSVTFTNTSQFSDRLRWNMGDHGGFRTGNQVNYAYLEEGDYTVTLIAEGAGGCNDTISREISVIPKPEPLFDYEIIESDNGCSPVIVQFYNRSSFPGSGNGTLVWDFGNGTPQHTEFTDPEPVRYTNFSGVDSAFTVTLTAETPIGCSATYSLDVLICSTLEVPNAFTPNGDGINDSFKPLVERASEYVFEVYSRSGEKVFETDDPLTRWDGLHYQNGRECPQGVYLYQFEVVNTAGRSTGRQVGRVLLMR